MLKDPIFFEEVLPDSGVDYVYLGYYEKAIPDVALEYFRDHYPLVFSSGRIEIYDVR